MIVYHLTLDLDSAYSSNALSLIEGDTAGELCFRLRRGNRSAEVDFDTALLTGRKSDGTLFEYGALIADGEVRAPIVGQMTCVPGTVACELRLIARDGTLKHAPRFEIRVCESLDGAASALSADDMQALGDLIASSAAAKERALSAAQDAELVTAAAVDAESLRAAAESARVSAEELRAQAERFRVDFENARKQEEVLRAIAEEQRAGAHAQRMSESGALLQDADEATRSALAAALTANGAAMRASESAQQLYRVELPAKCYQEMTFDGAGGVIGGTSSYPRKGVTAIGVDASLDARILLTDGYRAVAWSYSTAPGTAAHTSSSALGRTLIDASTHLKNVLKNGAKSVCIEFLRTDGTVFGLDSAGVFGGFGVFLRSERTFPSEYTLGYGLLSSTGAVSSANNKRAYTSPIPAQTLYLKCSGAMIGVFPYDADGNYLSSGYLPLGAYDRIYTPPSGAKTLRFALAGDPNSTIFTTSQYYYRLTPVILGAQIYGEDSSVVRLYSSLSSKIEEAQNMAANSEALAGIAAAEALAEESARTASAAATAVGGKIDASGVCCEPIVLHWEAHKTISSTGLETVPGAGNDRARSQLIRNRRLLISVDLNKAKITKICCFDGAGRFLSQITNVDGCSQILTEGIVPAYTSSIRLVAALSDGADIVEAEDAGAARNIDAIKTGITVTAFAGRNDLISDRPRSAGVRNAIAKMRQASELTFRTKASLPAQNGDIPAGRIKSGLYYSSARRNNGYVPNFVSYETYMTALHHCGSDLYTKTQTDALGGTASNGKTWYGCVCSSLVRHALDIRPAYVTANWGDIPGMRRVSPADYHLSELGDTICSNSSGHVVMITDVIRDGGGNVRFIEVIEAVAPAVKRTMRTPGELAEALPLGDGENDYALFRYDCIDDVTYEPSPFVTLSDDAPVSPYVYNDVLMLRRGNKSNFLSGEDVIVDVFNASAYTGVELLKDGAAAPAPALSSAITLQGLAVGDYKLRLTGNGDPSDWVAWKVSSAAVDGLAVSDGVLRVTFSSSGCTPVCVQCARFPDLNVRAVCALTPEDLENGFAEMPAPGEACYVRLICKNDFGMFSSADGASSLLNA